MDTLYSYVDGTDTQFARNSKLLVAAIAFCAVLAISADNATIIAVIVTLMLIFSNPSKNDSWHVPFAGFLAGVAMSKSLSGDMPLLLLVSFLVIPVCVFEVSVLPPNRYIYVVVVGACALGATTGSNALMLSWIVGSLVVMLFTTRGGRRVGKLPDGEDFFTPVGLGLVLVIAVGVASIVDPDVVSYLPDVDYFRSPVRFAS